MFVLHLEMCVEIKAKLLLFFSFVFCCWLHLPRRVNHCIGVDVVGDACSGNNRSTAGNSKVKIEVVSKGNKLASSQAAGGSKSPKG